MFQDRLILRTKLAPPRLHRDTLHRERITKRLLDARDYRLTVIQAGTGYGKTTALAELAAEDHKLVWYHLDPVDADPLTFLLHLIYGFSKLFADIADTPLALLESWERDVKDSPWSSVIDTLTNSLSEEVNEPVYVILDAAHYLNDSAETIQIVDYLIGRSPQNIHLIFILSVMIFPRGIVGTWRSKGLNTLGGWRRLLRLNGNRASASDDK
jgi:ATP/maltotriose-dependent transcriptional regulator MalT